MKKVIAMVLGTMLLFCLAACGEKTTDKYQTDVATSPGEINHPTDAVFATENAKRITFYLYYGTGKGSDASTEQWAEIVNWLSSFKVDTQREYSDPVPPGTNTVYVEIEYADGSVVKQGMEVVTIDGTAYYICGDDAPECYNEILSKCDLYE